MNVLITGGAGFIGSALTARLAAEGHRLAVVDNGSTGDLPRLRDAGALHPPGLLELDISGHGAELRDFFAAAQPHAVIHLAAGANVPDSLADPVGGAAVNVCGTVNVLRQSLAFGVRRFVFASTGGALYGDSAARPTPETAPPAPLSPYGASKAAAEVYVKSMSLLGGMRYTILRYGNVYGPGQGGAGVVGAFARAMLDGARPVIHGDGLNERDYVHVDDVVQAHRLALRMRGDGIFNIATGTALTVRQVFESVARAAGYRGEPAYGDARRGDLRHCRLDVTLARQVLRWWPQVPFERGIQQTVDSMRPRAKTGALALALR